MSEPTTDKLGLKPEWILLLLVSVGVAAVLGTPIGIVIAILATYIRGGSVPEQENTIIIWLQWMKWAGPLAMGVVTFAMGIPFVRWDAPAKTKWKVIATGAVWLGYVVLVLAGKTYVELYVSQVTWGLVNDLVLWTTLAIIAIIPSVVTLLIWRRKLGDTQPPQ
jgi:hypothetical protein